MPLRDAHHMAFTAQGSSGDAPQKPCTSHAKASHREFPELEEASIDMELLADLERH